MKETTDIRWLAEAARHGDAQACKVIVEQCGRQVFSVVRRMVANVMDAEEVTQDALMRGLQQMEQHPAPLCAPPCSVAHEPSAQEKKLARDFGTK